MIGVLKMPEIKKEDNYEIDGSIESRLEVIEEILNDIETKLSDIDWATDGLHKEIKELKEIFERNLMVR